MATTLDEVVALAQREQGLAVVATLRADQTIQASLVNAGALLHPITGESAIAFVTYGATKLRNIRARPNIALTFRSVRLPRSIAPLSTIPRWLNLRAIWRPI